MCELLWYRGIAPETGQTGVVVRALEGASAASASAIVSPHALRIISAISSKEMEHPGWRKP
ncbi:MAG: hypothetical protein LWX01_01530 [Deltaproteobacteria bacterium]|nr:hypothetical protein [Deltaproteobacteria bacterium]